MRAKSRTISFPAQAASRQLLGFGGMVRRLALRESTGANPAQFVLWDGTGSSGQMLDPVNLNAGERFTQPYRWDEYPIWNGLFLQMDVGTIDLVVVFTPADECDDWGEPVVILGGVTINA